MVFAGSPYIVNRLGDTFEQRGGLGVRLHNKALLLSLPDGDQYFVFPRYQLIGVCRVVADLAFCGIPVMGSFLLPSRRFLLRSPRPRPAPLFSYSPAGF